MGKGDIAISKTLGIDAPITSLDKQAVRKNEGEGASPCARARATSQPIIRDRHYVRMRALSRSLPLPLSLSPSPPLFIIFSSLSKSSLRPIFVPSTKQLCLTEYCSSLNFISSSISLSGQKRLRLFIRLSLSSLALSHSLPFAFNRHSYVDRLKFSFAKSALRRLREREGEWRIVCAELTVPGSPSPLQIFIHTNVNLTSRVNEIGQSLSKLSRPERNSIARQSIPRFSFFPRCLSFAHPLSLNRMICATDPIPLQ